MYFVSNDRTVDLFYLVHTRIQKDDINITINLQEGMRQQIHGEREEEDEQEQEDVNNTNKNTSQDQQTEQLEEEDVENFLENERIASSQEKVSEIDSQYVPHEGMEFSTSSLVINSSITMVIWLDLQ